MADKSPQQQVQELKDLVVSYAKQETVDPIKNIGRYIGWALAGALAFGVGMTFLAVGALRMLQTTLPELLDGQGKSSWFPYLAVLLLLGSALGLVAMKLTKSKADTSKEVR